MKGWVEKAAPGVSSATVKVPLGMALALLVVVSCGRGVWFLARQLPLWLVAGCGLASLQLYGYAGGTGLCAAGFGVVAVLAVWRVAHRGSFDRCVWWPLRGWARGLAVYAPGWGELMTVCGLAHRVDGRYRVPRRGRTRSTSTVDRVRVRTLRGQTLADFADNTTRFAESTGALDCRVRRRHWPSLRLAGRRFGGQVRARVLDLWFLITDPLVAPVPLFEVDERPNLKRLPLALREDGLPWALRLLATHVLVVGRTGAGKGSVLWSLVRALGPAIRDRWVELWVLDPKGGMEFAAGQALFARYCYGDQPDDDAPGKGVSRPFQEVFADFLDTIVTEMRQRQQQLRGRTRSHHAEPGSPHIVVLIDELASLTAYVADTKLKKRLEQALALLLSQGRAVGISVVAASQDVRKEVVGDRGLFPTRIALGLSEPGETDLVLGSVARKNGARCDEISEDTPGVAFVAVEESREPVRVRFAYIDDQEITAMTGRYQPGATPLHAVTDLNDTRTETGQEHAA